MENEKFCINAKDLPKEVREYLEQFETYKDEIIRLLDVGLAVVKRVELTRDVEYIKKEAKNIISEFNNSLDSNLDEFEKKLNLSLVANFDPSADSSYTKKMGNFFREELLGFKNGVSDTIKIMMDNAEKVSTNRLNDISDSLDDIDEKLNPELEVSYLGKLKKFIENAQNEINKNLDSKVEGTFAERLKKGLEHYFGDSSPILTEFDSKMDVFSDKINSEIIKLREEISFRKGVDETMQKTAIKGFAFEDEVEEFLSNYSSIYEDISVRFSTAANFADKKGDFGYTFNGMTPIVIECKNSSIGLKPTLEYLDLAMENRACDFSIVVVKLPEQLPKDVKGFNLYEGNKLFVDFDNLAIALKFTRLYKNFSSSDSSAINKSIITNGISKIQNSLKNISGVKTKLTSIAKNTTSSIDDVKLILDALQKDINSVCDIIFAEVEK